jgi:hypothetical protein
MLLLMNGVYGQSTWRTQAQVVSGFVEYENQQDEGIQVYNLAIDSTLVLGKGFPFHVEATTATLSDHNGNLRAFSNGCAVFRGDLSPMPGGEILNPGDVHNISCPTAGYIAEQGAFFIDKPGSPGRFLLIHAGMDHLTNNFLHVGRIAWTEIDFNADSAGVVVQSNVIIAQGDFEPATATRHGNGRDWWLLVPVRHSAEVQIFLIDTAGIEYMGSQWLSDFVNKIESRWAFLGHCFSPDGQYWARYNTNTGLYVYHFDRCSGLLSDLSRIPFIKNDEFGGGGVLFSMSGRFVYFTHQRLLYRVDIEQAPTKLDTIYTITGGTGGTFHRMFAGPEGNILISPMARATHWHVIENTDEEDPNQVNLKLREKILPYYSVRSVPHAINLQLGKQKGSICDSLSVAVENPYINELLSFRLFPNPASNRVRIELLSPSSFNKPLQVQIISLQGTVVYEGQLPPWAYIHEIPLSSFSSGIYVAKLSEFDTNRSNSIQFKVN